MDRYYSTESTDSEVDYEMISRCTRSDSCDLPFDYSSIEDIILSICDQFDLKVILGSQRVERSAAMTAGLTIAGSVIGKYLGGKIGAAAGGAVGGMCGIGLTIVSLRDVWTEIKPKIMDIFDLVYDYLAGLGIHDYQRAFATLANKPELVELVTIIANSISTLLGDKVVSSLNSRALMET